MEGLTAVKTHRTQSNQEPEPALTIRSSHKVSRQGEDVAKVATQDGLNQHKKVSNVSTKRDIECASPEDALHILRSQPDTETLITTLSQLQSGHGFAKPFALSYPGPLQGQIVNTLVTVITPTFWASLDGKDRRLLVKCLCNITGLNAVIARIRSLSNDSAADKSHELQDLLTLTDLLLHGDDFLLELWSGLMTSGSEGVKLNLAWKELANLLSSARIVGIAAQAEDVVWQSKGKVRTKSLWLANSAEYCNWIGRNIASLAASSTSASHQRCAEDAAKVLDRSLGLRQPVSLMKGLLGKLLSSQAEESPSEDAAMALRALLGPLPVFRKRDFIEQCLQWFSVLLPEEEIDGDTMASTQAKKTTAAAALLEALLKNEENMQNGLIEFLADAPRSAALSFPVRLAAICTLSAANCDELQTLLERLMATFSDSLFISHAPIIQQESLAQTLLLSAGYLHRHQPMAVFVTARSAGHMQGVSDRLGASNERARWLGMVVAMAISQLVDKEGQKMDFGVEETKTEEAVWYRNLVGFKDQPGSLEDFSKLLRESETKKPVRRKPRQPALEKMPNINGKPVFGPPRPPPPQPVASQTEVVGEKISEVVESGDEDEDDDLTPYAKPDSDPEDSDEDATLVNRNRPRPPVYIRDLMRMLADDQNAERFQLAIQHAASLVRRKSTFGSEVKDHAVELLSTLCNLQDPFDTENFDELRLQTMIAVLLSDISVLGPWLSKHAFAEGYSIAQRCLMFTALGLGGRELAGFKTEDETFNPKLQNTDFPSKRLPPRMHAIYTGAQQITRRLEAAHQSVENSLIQPLALQAADQTTSHLNAVKVRTFSSRLSNENRTKRRPTPNLLAKIFGPAFFAPLVGRYQQDIAAYGSASILISAPFVLVTFLKTLALLLHASGPATLGLASITADFWDLLLGLRVQASGDISVLEAVLFGLLTLLEVNQDGYERLAAEIPRRIAEAQEWVQVVFEKVGGGETVGVGGGGSQEEEKVRVLAAGVMVRLGQIVRGEQRRVFGAEVG
ncbi:hypothetical protein KC327_g17609 [Hortaea werneckii]|uniref:Telomere length regulation protein conserved domain-containing protein n=2 Tax=Hortaea werneckii TaxID=91943 RepID=A0A3M7I088_HORWE|nr:hypothetical protein KC358_g17696 [Hortaea werneckii]OTA33954.1 hypothetical protein BTJ68_07500 [Hortaea werneckii EXF-2000]KAI6792472.1 hypothetical protein KC350_g17591 [Hortaea werneckii]KAI6897939.1 hypothetical protein KC348_g17600 [Hortaea werneckii]KAI6952335.1 hypothetical protein KC321_g17624 [Hortaea werneckii]